jgi:L-ascorbate metabolism protein UlaG (beta-lactamase superfamily)
MNKAEIIAALWRDLLEKDDRPSPDKYPYPDMALISRDEFEAALSAAQADMRKMAAKLARGVVIENHYRRWPQWNPDGDLHADCDLVAFADATADAIECLSVAGEEERAK